MYMRMEMGVCFYGNLILKSYTMYTRLNVINPISQKCGALS